MRSADDQSTKQLSGIPQIDKSVFLLISVSLSVYLVSRAILVPMAHDEIATFYYFVQSGKVSPFLSNIDTNNHFLNSALTWIFYQLFGPGPLSLRLSNLIFIPVFFYFLYKLSQHLTSRLFRYVFFISLAFTLHFIEFLALSRGYGISMAMLLGSLYYLLEGVSKKSQRSYIYSLICIFVACTANLALINTYLLILLFVATNLIINNVKKMRSAMTIILNTGIIPISLIIIQILYIKIHAGLIAGSPENFWATTIVTLFAYLFESSHFYSSLIAAALFAIIAVAAAFSFFRLKTYKQLFTSKPYLFLYLFTGSIIIILVLRIFFNVNYPDDRIGLYLYPLALGSLIFLLDQLFSKSRWVYLVSVPFLIIPIHFFIYLNTTYSIWYKYDVIPARFYNQIMQNHKAGSIPPTIAGHGMRIFCLSYINYLNGGEASQLFFTHFPDYNAEFQIVDLKMIPGWQACYDTMDYDPVSERHLLQHKRTSEPKLLTIKHVNIITKTNAEFTPIAEGKADTLRNRNLRVDLNFSLYAPEKPFNGRIVFDIWDKQNKSLRYEYIQFNWLRNFWDGTPGNFINCMIVYKVPPEASVYKIYIWNIDKEEFEVKDGLVRIYEISE